jgi:hypothetical protein
MSHFETLFGATLKTASGDSPTAEVLAGKKAVALYFKQGRPWSAHRGPHRGRISLVSQAREKSERRARQHQRDTDSFGVL